MSIKSLQIGLTGFFLCIAGAWAGTSSIQGIVKDAKGQPVKNADVRVESRDGKQLFNTVKTEANGRYTSQELPVGTYRVTLLVNGAVKASIMNTQTRSNQPTQLNFDLKSASGSQAGDATKKRTHMVWMPSRTGSHLGGNWVEVDESGNTTDGSNVKTGNAEALHRAQQLNRGAGNLPLVGNGTQP